MAGVHREAEGPGGHASRGRRHLSFRIFVNLEKGIGRQVTASCWRVASLWAMGADGGNWQHILLGHRDPDDQQLAKQRDFVSFSEGAESKKNCS